MTRKVKMPRKGYSAVFSGLSGGAEEAPRGSPWDEDQGEENFDGEETLIPVSHWHEACPGETSCFDENGGRVCSPTCTCDCHRFCICPSMTRAVENGVHIGCGRPVAPAYGCYCAMCGVSDTEPKVRRPCLGDRHDLRPRLIRAGSVEEKKGGG